MEHISTSKALNSREKPGTVSIITEKICPFMSSAGAEVACTPACKLYKHNAQGYECPLQELNAISFQLKTIAGNGGRR